MQLAECTRFPPGGRKILQGFLAASVEICYHMDAALPATGRRWVCCISLSVFLCRSQPASLATACADGSTNARRAVNVFQQGRTPGEIAALRGFAPLGGLLITLSAWLDAILIISRRLTTCKPKKFSHSRASFRATSGKAAAFLKDCKV